MHLIDVCRPPPFVVPASLSATLCVCLFVLVPKRQISYYYTVTDTLGKPSFTITLVHLRYLGNAHRDECR